MINRKIIVAAVLLLVSCNTGRDTKFGKQYNTIRQQYGSPVIHNYMKLKSTSDSYENWITPLGIHDTITAGFHAGKGFYIHQDSVLQEDDIFRKRIDDSTFAYVAILTYGNLNKNRFSSIYYDSVDAGYLKLKAWEIFNPKNSHRTFTTKQLTIYQADSILQEWGTGRF